MWKAEGFAGFMKGNGINVVRVSTLQWHLHAQGLGSGHPALVVCTAALG